MKVGYRTASAVNYLLFLAIDKVGSFMSIKDIFHFHFCSNWRFSFHNYI